MLIILLAVVGLCVVAAVVACMTFTQPVRGVISPPASWQRADPQRLQADVRMLVESFFPRDYTHPGNLDLAAAYLGEQLEQAGGKVSEQSYEVAGRSYRNVVAAFGAETDDRIVVGAHYDACEPLPGADDNASGTAGLLELARMLGRAELARRVELVAYTLEEPPFFRSPQMGSAVHARSLHRSGVRVRAMISLEMIGFFSDEPGSQELPPLFGALYPSTGNFIAIVGKWGHPRLVREIKKAMRGATDLPVESINAPAWIPGVDFSDHLNFWRHGYPAVMLTDTAFYRNGAYHSARDTPETLDYDRMAKVIDGVFNAVVALAAP
ncbi:MAG: M28 family peptidase [bacterium]|nr:M28 family peptidase [bacterium]